MLFPPVASLANLAPGATPSPFQPSSAIHQRVFCPSSFPSPLPPSGPPCPPTHLHSPWMEQVGVRAEVVPHSTSECGRAACALSWGRRIPCSSGHVGLPVHTFPTPFFPGVWGEEMLRGHSLCLFPSWRWMDLHGQSCTGPSSYRPYHMLPSWDLKRSMVWLQPPYLLHPELGQQAGEPRWRSLRTGGWGKTGEQVHTVSTYSPVHPYPPGFSKAPLLVFPGPGWSRQWSLWWQVGRQVWTMLSTGIGCSWVHHQKSKILTYKSPWKFLFFHASFCTLSLSFFLLCSAQQFAFGVPQLLKSLL